MISIICFDVNCYVTGEGNFESEFCFKEKLSTFRKQQQGIYIKSDFKLYFMLTFKIRVVIKKQIFKKEIMLHDIKVKKFIKFYTIIKIFYDKEKR